MEGYAKLPVERIAHVHAKDCMVENHKATWLELGTGAIPWPEQMDALARDGYTGWISLETHWPGPGGDKLAGSVDLRAESEKTGGVREAFLFTAETRRRREKSKGVSPRLCVSAVKCHFFFS